MMAACESHELKNAHNHALWRITDIETWQDMALRDDMGDFWQSS